MTRSLKLSTMKQIQHLLKKSKKALVLIAIVGGGLFSFSFVDNYFEISKNLKILNDIYRELHTYYVDQTSPGDLMKKSIDSMLASLDPYTTYIPESQIEDYRFMTTGQYGGIGALISRGDEYVVIAEPYEGFPAHKAGLRAGDKITAIDGETTKGKSTSGVSKVLKGQPGTIVKLSIKRGANEEFVKELSREEVKIPSVPYSGMLDETTGYIKLSSFTETANKDVLEAFNNLKTEENMQRLVFDLRGNGGGLLREAVNIVNMFVDKGEVIVSTRGRIKDWDKKYKALSNPVDLEMPIIVLVDKHSASASEIVAGAIQDLDRGVVIGQQSFGKGLVQQTRNLDYNSKLKLTVAKYYTPSGRCIQRIDYSNKDDEGKAGEIPDSLVSIFKTLNGRKVLDGQGITPDVKVNLEKYSKITSALLVKNLIFDFATEYRATKEELAKPTEYKLSDQDFSAFREFIKGKDYSYETGTEKALEELKEIAEKEKYFEGAEEMFESLKKKLAPDNENDLEKFRDEISELIEAEIVSRYYFQNGRIQASLSNDPYIAEALAVLNDTKRYNEILKVPTKE